MQRSTAKHQAELRESHQREEGLLEPERSRTSQGDLQKQLTGAHWGSRSLNRQAGILHGTNLGPLHICDSCVSWSTVGILAMGA